MRAYACESRTRERREKGGGKIVLRNGVTRSRRATLLRGVEHSSHVLLIG